MITGGVGLGIGAQNYDLILLFQTETRLNEFLNGSWDANTAATRSLRVRLRVRVAIFLNFLDLCRGLQARSLPTVW